MEEEPTTFQRMDFFPSSGGKGDREN